MQVVWGNYRKCIEWRSATVKALLGGLLNADLSGIQNATINQITCWAKDGIPMNIKIADNGHVHIYLDKSAFDNLFTLRSTGGN